MSKVTLYALSDSMIDLLDQVDPETGELPEEFGSVRALVEDKAAAVAAYIANTDQHVAGMKAALKSAQARVGQAEKRADRLRAYLADCMARTGIKTIEAADGLLRVRLYPGRDESVEVYDAALLPAELIRRKVSEEPDKTAIKKAIKEGRDVQGARIVARDRLTIE